jgi:hypothetical protein
MSTNDQETIEHMTHAPDLIATYRSMHGGRHINARWLLHESDNGAAEVTVLRVSHYAGRPYLATLGRASRNADGSEISAPLSDVEVLRRTVARFNAKTFSAFAREALATVQDPANTERFARKFDPNTGLDD